MSPEAKEAVEGFRATVKRIRESLQSLFEKIRDGMDHRDHSVLHKHRNDVNRNGMPVNRRKGVGHYRRPQGKKK